MSCAIPHYQYFNVCPHELGFATFIYRGFSERHWRSVCSKGISPNEVFPVASSPNSFPVDHQWETHVGGCLDSPCFVVASASPSRMENHQKHTLLWKALGATSENVGATGATLCCIHNLDENWNRFCSDHNPPWFVEDIPNPHPTSASKHATDKTFLKKKEMINTG